MTCPARIKRLLIAFLMLVLLLIGVLMTWSRVMMPPLQKYYLMDYLDSTVWQGAPGMETEVVWLYKDAPTREKELISEEDVVPTATNKRSKLPVKLSSSAHADGWRDIKPIPSIDTSAHQEGYLKAFVYDGNSLWRVFLLPLLGYALAVLILLAIRDWWKDRSRHEAWWNEWRAKESSFSWEKGWEKVRIALTKREEPPISIVPRTVWQAPKKPALLPAATPLPPKRRVAPAPATKPKEPYVWDESKWID